MERVWENFLVLVNESEGYNEEISVIGGNFGFNNVFFDRMQYGR